MSTLEVVRGDITTIRVDAIVNAANSSLLGGGGVDGAIHRVGGPTILARCREIRRTVLPDGLPPGDAIATTAGDLPASWVVHTVGPVYSRGEDRSPQLRSAYRRSLEVAAELGAASISFPLISAGAYGWPLDDAVRTAVETVRSTTDEMSAPPHRIVFVAFGDEAGDRLEKAVAS